MAELESHRQRQIAESFGVDPERYDRARPRYPEWRSSRRCGRVRCSLARVPDAAPGPLHLVQSFVNTASRDAAAADLLATREEAAAWLRAAALLPADSGLSGSEHAALLRLREAVRDSLAAHTGGGEDPEAASRLTKALAEGRLVVTVDAASTVQLASAARASYPGVVAAIAVAIAEAAAAGTWLRLKSCSGQACYDNSAAADAQGCETHTAG